MNRRIASLRARPVTEEERHASVLAVLACLATLALVLWLTQSASRPSAAASTRATTARTTPTAGAAALDVSPQGTVNVARRFLRGYLAYSYRGLPGKNVLGGTPELVRSLGEHPPRPVARALSLPRIVAVDLASTSSGQFVANAIVNNGGIVNFTVGLLIARRGRRFLVTGVEDGR
jgi:hypothetical protein